ncbi:hypothetical protein [Microbacterium yannicii]|uniref:hypothetical protein n=1 Tax=Microbacterium yannicii TaxID=671622 RepID=UPI0002F4C33B|nr:hypothetical protein [Microbacterium yannicii]
MGPATGSGGTGGAVRAAASVADDAGDAAGWGFWGFSGHGFLRDRGRLFCQGGGEVDIRELDVLERGIVVEHGIVV